MNRSRLEAIEAHVRPTICDTFSTGQGHTVEGRILKDDFEALVAAVRIGALRLTPPAPGNSVAPPATMIYPDQKIAELCAEAAKLRSVLAEFVAIDGGTSPYTGRLTDNFDEGDSRSWPSDRLTHALAAARALIPPPKE